MNRLTQPLFRSLWDFQKWLEVLAKLAFTDNAKPALNTLDTLLPRGLSE
jgi:hypothetical protein